MMPGRVLLVEDDTVLAAELQVLLGRAGYQVTWAADGQDGLAVETMLRLGPLKLDLLARRAFRDAATWRCCRTSSGCWNT